MIEIAKNDRTSVTPLEQIRQHTTAVHELSRAHAEELLDSLLHSLTLARSVETLVLLGPGITECARASARELGHQIQRLQMQLKLPISSAAELGLG